MPATCDCASETIGTLRTEQRGQCVERRFTEAERAELERRVRAGEDLTPGQVAGVLRVARSAVHRWLVRGRTTSDQQFRSERKPGTRHRLVKAADVVAVLDGEEPEAP